MRSGCIPGQEGLGTNNWLSRVYLSFGPGKFSYFSADWVTVVVANTIVNMSKSRRGKSASANELSRWETELIQTPFNEVQIYGCSILCSTFELFYCVWICWLNVRVFWLYIRKHGDLACISSFQTEWKTMCLSTFCQKLLRLALESCTALLRSTVLLKM